VTASNESCFPGQVKFNIKDHMTINVFVPNGDLVVVPKLEGWFDVLHFFVYRLTPKVGSGNFVYLEGRFDAFRELNAVLVRSTSVARLDLLDDTGTLPQYGTYPPGKCWFPCDLVCYSVFGCFYWI
jgi:hypothetical protein